VNNLVVTCLFIKISTRCVACGNIFFAVHTDTYVLSLLENVGPGIPGVFFICGTLLAKRKELTGPEATAKSPAL
jgi:hypothetical protein